MGNKGLISLLASFAAILLACLILCGCIDQADAPKAEDLVKEAAHVIPFDDSDGAGMKGFVYLDRGLDVYMIISGAEWQYDRKLHYVEFYKNENCPDTMKIGSNNYTGKKEQIMAEWLETTMEFGHFDLISQTTCKVGKYDAWGYEFRYHKQDIDAALKYYVWFTNRKFYLFCAVAEGDFSTEFDETIDIALKSFLTCKEYDKQETTPLQ